jgi:hypothetical protein
MKKIHLLKGMTVVALALAVTGCKKDLYDAGAQQQAKEAEFSNNFERGVLGGQSVDPNQTWSTAGKLQVSVTPRQSGTLKVYTANPIGSITASLYTASVTASQTTTFSVTRPLDIDKLYAAVLDTDEMILDLVPFDATVERAEVNMNMSSGEVGTRAVARRAMPETPTFRDTNPIVKPTMPTKYKNTLAEAIADGAYYAKDKQNYSNGDKIYINTDYQSLNNPQNFSDLTIYVDGNVTYYGGTNQNGNGTAICVTQNSTLKLGAVSERLTVYLAPGATLDVSECLNWQGKPSTDWQGNPITSFSFAKSNAALYMNSGSRLIGGNLTFIDGYSVLNAGGTITATKLSVNNNQSTIWNEGTITTTELEFVNDNAFVYNAAGKTITADVINIRNNNDLLYNDGTVNATGAITVYNTTAEVVNNGTLTAASYSQAAGGKMHNVGTTTISGKTDLTNSNSKWMNDGQYTSGSFDVDNYSKQNYNNCKLTVTGNFHLNRGEFVINSGASVKCGSFTWEDTSNFYLGGKSMLLVEGDLLTKNYNSGYGFRGYGDDYAVIKANAVKIESNEQFRMSYFGKLYIDTDNHFDQWYKDAPNTNQPCYYYETSVKWSKDEATAPVSIPASNCNPGYNGGVTVTDPTMYYYYAFEDLGTTDDFDFNDVILRLSAPVNGKSTVQLMAAGGTLAAQVFYGNTDTKVGEEVHKMFNVDTSTMVNTGRGTFVNNFPTLGTVDIADDADMANLPFGILVENNDGSTTKVTKSVENNGKAPLVIVVNGYKSGSNTGKWFWPKERVNIAISYETFGAWGTNASTNKSWYEESNYNSGTVMTY